MYKIFIKMYVLFVCSVQYDYCTLGQGVGWERERRAGGGWFCTVKIITVQCTGLDRWGGQSWGERRIQLWGEKRNQSWGGESMMYGVHILCTVQTTLTCSHPPLAPPPPLPSHQGLYSLAICFLLISHLYKLNIRFI